ncbi:hypothetical protein TKK_0014803 [Trichogramma kaykai]
MKKCQREDRHVKGANREPQMDSSQDYHLQSGYENKTHTVLRFNRRYDTCDPRDLKITWMANETDHREENMIVVRCAAMNYLRPQKSEIFCFQGEVRVCETL